MKKIITLVSLSLFLSACSVAIPFLSPSTKSKVITSVEKSSVLNINELTDYQWDHLRIIHPYEKKTVLGTEYSQADDKACIWIIVGAEEVEETFSIDRETIDCVDLPNQVFKPSEAIFLIDKKGKLKVRKKFERRQ